MKLYKLKNAVILESEGGFVDMGPRNWDDLINMDGLFAYLKSAIDRCRIMDPKSANALLTLELLAPVGAQEIWAAGVTYFRSKNARVEESKKAGGDSFYDKVYEAARPELFFKANPRRTAGHTGLVRIRRDSSWNVPEPELTVFINASGNIVGYTIGNDMSSRSIEGENPLYLPQAKIYEGSAALGPCLLVPEKPLAPETAIHLEIIREKEKIVSESTSLKEMKRQPEELKEYLFRECDFPEGVFLMTGTGIVPDGFTLLPGDTINITVPAIGTLSNTVASL